jgi:hypothetical protein
MMMMIRKGWRPASTSSYSLLKPALHQCIRKLPRSRRAGNMEVIRRSHHLTAHVGTRLLPPLRAESSYPHVRQKPLVLAIEPRPPRRDR